MEHMYFKRNLLWISVEFPNFSVGGLHVTWTHYWLGLVCGTCDSKFFLSVHKDDSSGLVFDESRLWTYSVQPKTILTHRVLVETYLTRFHILSSVLPRKLLGGFVSFLPVEDFSIYISLTDYFTHPVFVPEEGAVEWCYLRTNRETMDK